MAIEASGASGFDGLWMAGITLGLFWIHILLISGSALLDLRELGRLHRRLAGCRVGVVRNARGPDGLFARNRVEQLGRLDRRGGPAEIHFHDRSHQSEVFGGLVRLDDGVEIELAPAGSRGELWPDLRLRSKQAGGFELDQFTVAAEAAGRAKGFERAVETQVGVGDRVWICGHDSDGTPLVSVGDPRRFVRRSRALVAVFAIGNVLAAAICTLLAVWPPHFELVSMIGAAAALGWFLGVQPLGVAVHDAVRTPDRAYLRGSWRRG